MTNGMGTAEYFQLCDSLGTLPYITANITNQPPAIMASWLNHGTIVTSPTYKSYNDYNGVEPINLQSF